MKLKVTLIKSPIAAIPVHKKTIAALGFKKIGKTKIFEDNACVRGMIFQVKHLLQVEEVK